MWKSGRRLNSIILLLVLSLFYKNAKAAFISAPLLTTNRFHYSQQDDLEVWKPTVFAHKIESSNEEPVDALDTRGIYVHIPYCRKRCSYCDFAIVPIGDKNKSERSLAGFHKMDESYRNAITSEIDLLAQTLNSGDMKNIRLSSIYFGGGTPSLAPTETIQSIIDHILSPESPFDLEADAEVTIEMDPGTFTVEQLQELKQIGFNRISLGVQSFNDTILEGIGRVHRRNDIEAAIQNIGTVFGSKPNYSLDLISGLPGLTLDLWNQTIQHALSLKPSPNHLSIYDLQIEEGTSFAKWYPNRHEDDDDDGKNEDDDDDGNNEDDFNLRNDADTNAFNSVIDITAPSNVNIANGFLPLPTAEQCASMYRHASEYLRSNGFEHYEISSYARIKDTAQEPNANGKYESHRSKHNQIYWKVDGEWFAVGLSATSFMAGKRFARPRMMADYFSWVSEQSILLQKEGLSQQRIDWMPSYGNSEDDAEVKEEMLLDTILTRLRTKEGLDLNWIKAQDDGDKLLDCIRKGSELGVQLELAQFLPMEGDDEGTLRLNDPDGFLFSNSIISSIFAELP